MSAECSTCGDDLAYDLSCGRCAQRERAESAEAQVQSLTERLEALLVAAETIDAVRRPGVSAQSNLHVAIVAARAALPVPVEGPPADEWERIAFADLQPGEQVQVYVCDGETGWDWERRTVVDVGEHGVTFLGPHGDYISTDASCMFRRPVPVEGEADR